jgi:hypothetical protein
MILSQRASLSPEIRNPCWRQFRIAHRVLDIPVAEVSLHGSGVVALVGKRVAAGMTRHVRVRSSGQDAFDPGALDHAGGACGAERTPPNTNNATPRLHRGIPHDLLNACLIHRELRQMLFSRCMRRRHLSKVLLHPLKHKART